MHPRVPPALVGGRRGKAILASGGVGEVATGEGVGYVGARKGAVDSFWSVVGFEERALREQANCLRDGWLEEAAELRMREAVAGESLAEHEEGGKRPYDARLAA